MKKVIYCILLLLVFTSMVIASAEPLEYSERAAQSSVTWFFITVALGVITFSFDKKFKITDIGKNS